ncbi:MAG: NADH-quinone oxidoreductase subunit [Bacteroidales bacterium]|nr:NADH-quinone oxidoreductase subunit [Bacteroidales bacterium]MDN5329940.1 NADH-quinone oxidoreductase subunit [Bacteroidales bacterium]
MSFLLLFVIVPLLTVIAILFSKDIKQTRWIAAIGMSVQLLLSAVLILMYLKIRAAGITDDFVMVKRLVWFPSLNFNLTLGVDGISVSLISLTSIVIFAGVFASWQMESLHREFFISLIVLATGVFGFFITIDLFAMFVFYELAVIPMYLLIGIWGTGPKEYSAMKLTLMLMAGSALIIVGLLGIYFHSAPEGGHLTMNLLEISRHKIPENVQNFLFPFLFVGFGILGALFPLHTWSPDGHASAPTAVSMLHAGVLMKLGSYGVFRIALFLLPEAAHNQGALFLILATIGIVYGALGAIMQKDLKYINAYSSVSHCALILFGLLMFNRSAMDGAILQMISHGIMTALFFALIGMIYGRTHTRMINEMGGLLKVMPLLGAAYIIGGLASLGLPGFSGFVAEMMVFFGAFTHADTFHRVVTILAASSIVITAVYILRVVGVFLMGPVKNEHHLHLTDASWWEKLSVGTLLLFITLIGVFPHFVTETLIGNSLAPALERLMSNF